MRSTSRTVTAWALALVAFMWATTAGAQQTAPQGRDTRAGGFDSQTEDRILVRLAEREWVGGDFKVSVEDGRATLAGTVPSEGTKARIGRIAGQTIGVREVQNNLRVNPSVADAGTQVSDPDLEQRVARRIASQISGAKSGEDWWLDGWRVEGPDNVWNFVVEAENGRVYLEGDVPRVSIMRQAIDAARQTSGVQSVRSDLQVERVYRGGPYGPGYPYGPYGAFPHGYGPHAYDPDVQGSTITGQVTSIDRERGRVTVQTGSGSTQLPVPPSALEGVQQGQQVTVRIDFGNGAPSASPAGGRQQDRKDIQR